MIVALLLLLLLLTSPKFQVFAIILSSRLDLLCGYRTTMSFNYHPTTTTLVEISKCSIVGHRHVVVVGSSAAGCTSLDGVDWMAKDAWAGWGIISSEWNSFKISELSHHDLWTPRPFVRCHLMLQPPLGVRLLVVYMVFNSAAIISPGSCQIFDLVWLTKSLARKRTVDSSTNLFMCVTLVNSTWWVASGGRGGQSENQCVVSAQKAFASLEDGAKRDLLFILMMMMAVVNARDGCVGHLISSTYGTSLYFNEILSPGTWWCAALRDWIEWPDLIFACCI